MKTKIFLLSLLTLCCGCGINKVALRVTKLPCGTYSYGVELENEKNQSDRLDKR